MTEFYTVTIYNRGQVVNIFSFVGYMIFIVTIILLQLEKLKSETSEQARQETALLTVPIHPASPNSSPQLYYPALGLSGSPLSSYPILLIQFTPTCPPKTELHVTLRILEQRGHTDKAWPRPSRHRQLYLAHTIFKTQESPSKISRRLSFPEKPEDLA